MDNPQSDPGRALVLDGNAAAGLLQEIFAQEITISLTECANCGRAGDVGSLLLFSAGPGFILRCPTCEATMLRITQTPGGTYIDARGAAFLRLARQES